MDKAHPLGSSCRRLPALLVDSETSKIRVKSQCRVLGAIIHSCFCDFRNEVEWKQIGRHDINLTLCSTRPTSPHPPSAICGEIMTRIKRNRHPILRQKSTSIAYSRHQSQPPFVGILSRHSLDFEHSFIEFSHKPSPSRRNEARNRRSCTQPRDAD